MLTWVGIGRSVLVAIFAAYVFYTATMCSNPLWAQVSGMEELEKHILGVMIGLPHATFLDKFWFVAYGTLAYVVSVEHGFLYFVAKVLDGTFWFLPLTCE